MFSAQVSFSRIEKFLKHADVPSANYLDTPGVTPPLSDGVTSLTPSDREKNVALSLTDALTSWEPEADNASKKTRTQSADGATDEELGSAVFAKGDADSCRTGTDLLLNLVRSTPVCYWESFPCLKQRGVR